MCLLMAQPLTLKLTSLDESIRQVGCWNGAVKDVGIRTAGKLCFFTAGAVLDLFSHARVLLWAVAIV